MQGHPSSQPSSVVLGEVCDRRSRIPLMFRAKRNIALIPGFPSERRKTNNRVSLKIFPDLKTKYEALQFSLQ